MKNQVGLKWALLVSKLTLVVMFKIAILALNERKSPLLVLKFGHFE